MREDAPPTVRQVYALAAVLCDRYGQAFPETRSDASQLIERLRLAQGHPAPHLDDTVPRPPKRGGGRRFAKTIAREVARELR